MLHQLDAKLTCSTSSPLRILPAFQRLYVGHPSASWTWTKNPVSTRGHEIRGWMEGKKSQERTHSADVAILLLCLGLSPYMRGLFPAESNSTRTGEQAGWLTNNISVTKNVEYQWKCRARALVNSTGEAECSAPCCSGVPNALIAHHTTRPVPQARLCGLGEDHFSWAVHQSWAALRCIFAVLY